jgi:hypothetical protein
MMFLTSKLKISGDLIFAAGVQKLFRDPGSG